MAENPFLVPPPPRDEPPAKAESELEPIDPPPMITLPPGLVDSATMRIAAERATRRVVSDVPASAPVRPEKPEIVFFPAPPGRAPEAARASSPPTPAPPTSAPPTSAPPTAADATVIRPTRAARATAEWLLTLPDGRAVTVPSRLLLGRNPAPIGDWTDAELLPLTDPAKSVSKTHAAIEHVGDDLFVHDLDSTNGVWVIETGAEDRRVVPGERVTLPVGCALDLGEFRIRVGRTGR